MLVFTPWLGIATFYVLRQGLAAPTTQGHSPSGHNETIVKSRAPLYKLNEGQIHNSYPRHDHGRAIRSAHNHPEDSADGSLGDWWHDNINHMCDRLQPLLNPKPKSSKDHNIDGLFADWLHSHMDMGARNPQETPGRTFQSIWGEWAFGDPEWSCLDDGSRLCHPPYCGAYFLNEKDDEELRLAYYVTLSLVYLHSFYTGLAESFGGGSMIATLSKDQWAEDFWKDEVDTTKELSTGLKILGIVIGVLTNIAGAQPAIGRPLTILYSTTGLLANTLPGLVTGLLDEEAKDESFKRQQSLAKVFLKITTLLTASNNAIFTGDIQNRDTLGVTLPTYFKDGGMIDFDGVNKTKFVDSMTGLLLGSAINWVWRQQKVFIVGGAPCGEDDGLGLGPQWKSTICRDDQAWYIYYWDSDLTATPGMDLLGKEDYVTVTWKDVPESSMATYNLSVAGIEYTAELAADRISEALQTGVGNLFSPSWGGVFNIPVCNVHGMSYYHEMKMDDKSKILIGYDDSHPRWCGPICNNDRVKTNAFLEAANMKGEDVC